MAAPTTKTPAVKKVYLTGPLVLSVFNGWAATHPGLTGDQLIKGFTDAFMISEADKKALQELVKPSKAAPAPTPTPTPTPTPAPAKPTVKPELVIERIPYPKWWRDSLNATINLTAPGSQVLATVTGKLRLYVSVIVITVTGETVISFTFGNAGSSGPIYLGGESQPMGMVIAMGNSPAPCGNGNLVISATDPTSITPSVGGWATCFAVEEKEQKV